MKKYLLALACLLAVSLPSRSQDTRQSLPFFDAVLKVAESGPEFIGIRGKSMGDGNYESQVQIPGGIRPRIYQPVLGEKAWLVDLILTTSEEEAAMKYQDIAEQLNNGRWNSIGIIRGNREKDQAGETTVWGFTNLAKPYEKSHNNFVMELVISKNIRKQWQVYLKIRYDE